MYLLPNDFLSFQGVKLLVVKDLFHYYLLFMKNATTVYGDLSQCVVECD